MKFIKITVTNNRDYETQLINPLEIICVRPIRVEERQVHFNQPKDTMSNSVIELTGWTIRVKETLDEIEEKIAAAAT